jgi:outer membrane lipoprotein-sorting protein
MPTPSLRPLTVACLALLVSLGLQAAEPPIIAKARAYLGPAAALDGITSIHYVGTLVTSDAADPAKEERAALDLIFQRPDRQRIMATSDKIVEVTALDGYDAWQRISDATNPAKWRQTLLGSDQVKRLRANTFENLAYFSGYEAHGGRIEEQGVVEKDGVRCAKLAMIHPGGIVFYRYIDLASGRLVLTENDDGGETRESGEMIVDGIRFPKRVTLVLKRRGGDRVVTMTYDKITLNETFPASVFAVPGIR